MVGHAALDRRIGVRVPASQPSQMPASKSFSAVKTTIELPDSLFRQTKAAAALRGESINDFVTAALRAHLDFHGTEAPQERGWRSVFGKASSEEVGDLDRIVSEELERTDPGSWR
jgi:hypothetical protein